VPNEAQVIRLLAIGGSLRAGSTNSVLLEAAGRLAPLRTEVVFYRGLAGLPHFNADLENDELLPRQVAEWRDDVHKSDGLLLSCPEYAGGIPGVLKNALDWLVGDSRFQGKHICLLSASSRSLHAQSALRLVLQTMAAVVVESASTTIPLLGTSLKASDVVQNEGFSTALRKALRDFVDAIRQTKPTLSDGSTNARAAIDKPA
jgi:NAD(P)H-dependent FMN reductase